MNTRSISTPLKVAAIILMLCVTALAQRPASLRGHVTDQLGAVVVGVRVTLTSSSGQQQVAQTDNNGAYRFDNLAPGAYNLAANQTGFAAYARPDLNVAPGANTFDFQLA